jgi:hypothetical protein
VAQRKIKTIQARNDIRSTTAPEMMAGVTICTSRQPQVFSFIGFYSIIYLVVFVW